jgi:regulator of CtrA degradation
MTGKITTDQGEVPLQDFARSALFEKTFKDGMTLVDETADYLDGAGRQEAKMLSRTAALAYARESLTLTTLLMQAASWLLVQKAIREGDMPPKDAHQTRYRIKDDGVKSAPRPFGSAIMAEMPPRLTMLLERAERLYERVALLDRRMYLDEDQEPEINPVLAQFERLSAAFNNRP